jgi:hypothetical protein
MSKIGKEYDDLFDNVKGNLGEHFANYMFIVMDDKGNLFYDYSNHRVGRMLIHETHEDMTMNAFGDLDILWQDDEEGDEIDGTEV